MGIADFLGISDVSGDMRKVRFQLSRVERKLDLIMAKLEIPDDALDPPEIVALLAQGKKIPAIKLYRELTGAGLADAKDAVEEIERRTA